MSAGTNIVNAVRQNASASYQSQVAVLTDTNLTDVGNMILNFEPIYSEFVSVLFNRIALTILDARKYQNPFAQLTKAGQPLGGVTQDIHVNPAKPMPYDVEGTSRILQNYRPDIVTQYYNVNRRDVFAVTRIREDLELAFVSYDALDSFFTGLIDSLYNGDEIRKFALYKALIASAYINDMVRKVAVAEPVDEQTATAFLAVLQEYSLAFKFPSSAYNAYQSVANAKGFSVAPRVTWTPEEEQIVFMDSRLAPMIGLYVKASAFHEEYTKLAGRILYVDNFGLTGLMGIICDARWLQVREIKRAFRDFQNGATLSLSSFYHIWESYDICLWCNAIALYNPDAKNIDIEINGGNTVSIGIEESVEVPVTVEYEGEDITDVVNLDFTATTNNLVIGYNRETKMIKIVTSKYSVPSEYTILVTATYNSNSKPIADSVILTVTIE